MSTQQFAARKIPFGHLESTSHNPIGQADFWLSLFENTARPYHSTDSQAHDEIIFNHSVIKKNHQPVTQSSSQAGNNQKDIRQQHIALSTRHSSAGLLRQCDTCGTKVFRRGAQGHNRGSILIAIIHKTPHQATTCTTKIPATYRTRHKTGHTISQSYTTDQKCHPGNMRLQSLCQDTSQCTNTQKAKSYLSVKFFPIPALGVCQQVPVELLSPGLENTACISKRKW